MIRGQGFKIFRSGSEFKAAKNTSQQLIQLIYAFCEVIILNSSGTLWTRTNEGFNAYKRATGG